MPDPAQTPTEEARLEVGHVLLRRANLVTVAETTRAPSPPVRRWPWSREPKPTALFATFSAILARLGHAMGPRLAARVHAMSPAEMVTLRSWLEPELRARLGADRPYRPMYPRFPRQVLEASAAELHLNAMLHYFGDEIGARILPESHGQPRPPLPEPLQGLRILELADAQDPGRLAQQLMASRVAGSPASRDDLTTLIRGLGHDLPRWIPPEIPNKENLAATFRAVQQEAPAYLDHLVPFVQTATDVLRLAVAVSDGDLSLAAPCRFRSIRRPLRRWFLTRLEDLDPAQRDEDMGRRPEVWKRLGERLHPGEFARAFPGTARSFRAVRQGERPATPGRRVEAALRDGQPQAAAAALVARPGEFARRLDHLLRSVASSGAGAEAETEALLAQFEGCAPRVSTTVLLQVRAHFLARPAPPPLRVFFPKGSASSAFGTPDRRPALPPATCARVAEICSAKLVDRFGDGPSLGACWVDPGLAAFPVPFALRSSSRSLRTLTRGARLPLDCPATLRFFLWWREGKVDGKATGRVDVDLSAVLYRDDWAYAEHLSYTNLRNAAYRAAHSGDITSAPDGACEFIDLDLPSLRRHGVRYVVMAVQSFTGQPFASMPECFTGWMNRAEPESGEIFEPQTVVDRIDLAGDTKISIPLVLDLQEGELIWADLSLTRNCRWHNNVEGNARGMVLMGKALTHLVRPTLADLFALHATARGSKVDDPSAADTVFATPATASERGLAGAITPYDQDRIVAGFL